MKLIDIINRLSTARSEYQTEHGSVLNKFVVPFFIDKLDLRNISHSIALVGSRGSGKSTYIQYFSHSTRFDFTRQHVDESELDCILLYWKPDIAYCQGLKQSWLGANSHRFFCLHASLSLLGEIISFIENGAHHFNSLKSCLDPSSNFWKAVSKVTKTQIFAITGLREWIRDYKYEISTRLNPLNVEGMLSIQPKEMVEYLIEALQEDCGLLRKSTFKIFVDEFELLTVEQQKLINTYRKESNKRINWNVAYKSNAKLSNETISDQWLQSPDDFREENLDVYIEGSDYKLFAAEIFVLTLQNAGLKCSQHELTTEFLGDRANVCRRREEEYKEKVLTVLNNMLPTPSTKELAALCLSHNAVKSRLNSLLDSLQVDHDFRVRLINEPKLAVTLLGTHKQRKFDVDIFCKFLDGTATPKERKTLSEKVDTFTFNTLLSLNLQITSVNIPVYAGFERFITMTTPNIRHFKELCLSALKNSNDLDSNTDFSDLDELQRISYSGMHRAAISKSSDLVKEIVSYPPHGNRLSQMVHRIGELFRISQKSSHQTEPERDIFAIKYDFSGYDPDFESFIGSALSWRVLIEDDSKRIKDDTQITSKEFQLNPVYSPRFGISYRKKRGVTFTFKQFKTLLNGTSDEFEKMRKEYQRKWKSDDSESNPQGLLL